MTGVTPIGFDSKTKAPIFVSYLDELKFGWTFPSDVYSSEYTFEDFCKDYNLNVDEYDIYELWDIYYDNLTPPESLYPNLRGKFSEYLNKYELKPSTINIFIKDLFDMKSLHEYINETILRSNKPIDIYQDIYKKFQHKYKLKFRKEDNPYTEYYELILYGEERNLRNLYNDKEFNTILNYHNWCAYKNLEDPDDENSKLISIDIKPNMTENKTDEVYDLPKLYHYCPKFIYEERIKKYGLQPKHKFGSKYEKTYVYYSENPEILAKVWGAQKLRQIENEYKKEKASEGFVILEIDLSKDKRKISFYKDEESNSKYTYYTFDPIPPFCITKVININGKVVKE